MEDVDEDEDEDENKDEDEDQLVETTCPSDLFTRLIHQLVHPTCGALKTKSCSGLHLWIVHALEVFNSWIVQAWGKKLFQIGLMGRPCVEP